MRLWLRSRHQGVSLEKGELRLHYSVAVGPGALGQQHPTSRFGRAFARQLRLATGACYPRPDEAKAQLSRYVLPLTATATEEISLHPTLHLPGGPPSCLYASPLCKPVTVMGPGYQDADALLDSVVWYIPHSFQVTLV